MKKVKKYWKALAELNEDPIVKNLAENEFPEELPVDEFLGDEKSLSKTTTNRRDFLKFLKKTITSGKLGEIFLTTIRLRWSRGAKYYNQAKWRGTWKYDGGVIANQCAHHIDLS